MGKTAETVEDYIASAPKKAQPKLREMRAAIRTAAPTAREGISYRIPYYDYKGRLAWFGLQSKHIGLYLRPPVVAQHKKELAGYKTTLSAVHFPLDEKIDTKLVKNLVKARMKMNDAEPE